MSNLRWNSKQLLPKQFDNKSSRNKSQSFQKYGPMQKNSNFKVINQEKDKSFIGILQKLKIGNCKLSKTPGSKSTSNIICNIKRGKNQYITSKINNQEAQYLLQNKQQDKSHQDDKQKIKIVLKKVQFILKQVCKLFHQMKKQFNNFHEFILTQHLKFMANTQNSISIKLQSLQSFNDKNLNQLYFKTSDISSISNNVSLNNTPFGKEKKQHQVKIITPIKSVTVSKLNNVRKTESLTYSDLQQQKNLNLLTPNKKSSLNEKPIFSGLRTKLIKNGNIDDNPPMVSHSQIQIKKPIYNNRVNIHTQRNQKDSTYTSSVKNQNSNNYNNSLVTRLRGQTYPSRSSSPIAKQLQQRFDSTLKNMKEIIKQK